jgi:hypothetical protein
MEMNGEGKRKPLGLLLFSPHFLKRENSKL